MTVQVMYICEIFAKKTTKMEDDLKDKGTLNKYPCN